MTNFKQRQELVKALKNGCGIEKLVSEASKIMENGMVVIDTSYNLISYTKNVTTDDPFWNEIVALGAFTHEAVKFFNDEKFIEAYAVSDVVAVMKSSRLKYDRLNGKLFDRDNIQIGNITVIGFNRPFEKGDAELLETLCELLSVELQRSEFYAKISHVYNDSGLSRALTDNKPLNAAFSRALYKKLKRNIYLAVVDIFQFDKTVTHLAYFKDLFSKIQGEYEYFICLNNIVIIVSTDDSILSIKKHMGPLNTFFGENRIYAGVSSVFNDLKKLKQHFTEAINALNYGLNGKSLQCVFCFDNYRLERKLHACSFDIKEIANPIIEIIEEYDKVRGEQLFNTLFAYLRNGRRKDFTMVTLDITEAEFDRRMGILVNEMELDFDNGDMIVSIYVTLKLRE